MRKFLIFFDSTSHDTYSRQLTQGQVPGFTCNPKEWKTTKMISKLCNTTLQVFRQAYPIAQRSAYKCIYENLDNTKHWSQFIQLMRRSSRQKQHYRYLAASAPGSCHMSCHVQHPIQISSCTLGLALHAEVQPQKT